MAPMIKASFKGLFFMTSCTLIVLKITFFFATSFSSTSKIITTHSDGFDDDHFDMKPPLDQSQKILNPFISTRHQYDDVVRVLHEEQRLSTGDDMSGVAGNGDGISPEEKANISQVVVHEEGQLSPSAGGSNRSNREPLNNKEVYHDKDIFLESYKQMNKSFKIFVYPHAKTDPFANVLLPETQGSPGGNYASESYFKLVLSRSHFVTRDPSEADLFFLPFSIASMRHDKRIGVDGIQDFVKSYVSRISHEYPFWNRTGGADHFYVACHSIGRTAMEKAPEVRINAIQVVCSSSYFLQGYSAHKDASIPQIWPRPGVPLVHLLEEEMLI